MTLEKQVFAKNLLFLNSDSWDNTKKNYPWLTNLITFINNNDKSNIHMEEITLNKTYNDISDVNKDYMKVGAL